MLVQDQNLEQYKCWKKNTPFLYDRLLVHVLKWPSLTCKYYTTPKKDYLVLGTHTSGQDTENVHVFEDGKDFKIYQSITHSTEVNALDVMPQNNQIIATKMKDVCIFDRTKHVTHKIDQKPNPQLIHKNDAEGYTIEFSSMIPGQLLVGDDLGLSVYQIMDLTEEEQLSQKISPRYHYKTQIEAATWVKSHSSLVVAAGPKSYILDVRSDKVAVKLPTSNAKACDTHPSIASSLLLSCGNAIEFHDIRYAETPVHKFEYHDDEVLKCKYSPTHPSIFTSIAGNRLLVWDIMKINGMTDDEAPPELLFLHGGHNARIGDFDFHPTKPFQMASVDDENICHIFRIADEITWK
eukprot:NODE_2_length_91304_cov_0.692462.p29 type:complete len:350 gc:universal NODE_2_length_91304_cov_0.692462:68873-67824(-)